MSTKAAHEHEIPLKQWFCEEAERRCKSKWAIQQEFYRGHYALKLRRVNKRVVFVQSDSK